MGDYAIIFQILGVLLALFFIFLTVMNFKSWRWLHALTTFTVFCAVATFMVYAALVTKTRLTWTESSAKFTEAYEKQVKNVDKVVNGDPAEPDSVATSLAHYRNELARSLVDRGRVWRNCIPAGNADTVTLTMNLGAAPAPPAVDPNAGVPAAPAAPAVAKKHDLKAQDIVFAFKEFATPGGLSIPAYYVGQFQVVSVTETSVTLKLVPANWRPQAAIQAHEVDSSWMLYEVLPPDAHEPFAFPKEVSKAKRLEELAKIGIPAAVQESYARDNEPGDANDPKDNTWVEVKFTKSHEITVDAASLVSPVEEKHFDGQGQAQVSPLLRTKDIRTPEPVKFVKDDLAIFDQATADDLVNRGIAQRQRRIYRRQLNDYEQAFQAISRQLYVLRDKTAVVARDTATMVAARLAAVEQTKLLEAEKLLLQADKDKVVYERDQMKMYADAVAARIKEQRDEMSKLDQSIKNSHDQIQEKNRLMTEEVERREREGTLPVLTNEKK
jgi:hypothetical protein